MRRRTVSLASLAAGGIAAVCAVVAMAGGPSLTGSPAKAAASAPGTAHLTYAGELTQGGWIRGTVPAGTKSLMLGDQSVPIAPDGAWFAAFDRDAASQETLTVTAADGTVSQQAITISPRAWHIENINLPRLKGGPTEAFMKLRRPELAQIEAARAMRTGAQGWREHFIWPVKGRISGMFGSQRVYQGEPGAYHSGIDITTGRSGTPFVAPADGVVILVAKKPFTLEGNLLMIDHGMGLNSAFLHCSEILVKEGEHVKQGQVIGKIGMTGRATGPHLHWSIKWENDRLDPILLTGPMN